MRRTNQSSQIPSSRQKSDVAKVEFCALKDARNLDGALGGAAAGGEDAEVVEPGAAVELGVDGLDEPGLLGVRVGVGLGLDGDDAGDLLLGGDGAGGARDPANEDGVAVVPGVEDLEGDWSLTALAGDEGLAGGEGWLAELGRLSMSLCFVSDINGYHLRLLHHWSSRC
jgi:hypothetical protein